MLKYTKETVQHSPNDSDAAMLHFENLRITTWLIDWRAWRTGVYRAADAKIAIGPTQICRRRPDHDK